MPDTLQLAVYIDKKQKDDIIDCLLPLAQISGFSMSPCFGYSRDSAKLNVAEQVRGGRDLLKLDIVHESECTDIILDALRTINTRNPIRFTLSPVLAHGHID